MKVYMVTEKDLEHLRDQLEKVRLREGGAPIPCDGKPVDDLKRSYNFIVCRWFERLRERETLAPS